MSDYSFNDKKNLLIELGKALHKFGTPASRVETHLTRLAEFLGIQGYFLITPTALSFGIWEEDQDQHNTIVRVYPGAVNLNALARADELVEEFVSGGSNLHEIRLSIQNISDAKPLYPHWVKLIAFVLSAGAFVLVLSSTYYDFIYASFFGGAIYIQVYVAEKNKAFESMLEPFAALFVSFFASALASIDPNLNTSMVTLASVIIFIPGLALTLGLSDLSSRDLVSGTTRVMDALMVLCKLYFGAQLGAALATVIWGESSYVRPEAIDSIWRWPGVVLLSIGLGVVFNTRLKDMFWGGLAAMIAFASSLLASHYFGEALGPFFGALVVGVYSNLYSLLMKAPASIALLQGLIVLVPGSKTYINLDSFVSGQEMVMNATVATQTGLMFISIISGLIFANVIVPPKKSL